MTKVFVDGQEGTTGLQIHERLQHRKDLELLVIDPSLRKDPNEKKKLLNAADIVFLCLPDGAARESVALVENSHTCVIDASTAHRTAEGWTYGLPELNHTQRQSIGQSKRIANPGCHATGFALAVAPLVAANIIHTQASLFCHSITGYSGGGKKLIAQYEESENLARSVGSSPALQAPRVYALGLQHKHLPEMTKVSGLEISPHFNPILGPFYKGMAVSVPLLPSLLTRTCSVQEIHGILAEHYAGQTFVQVMPWEKNQALEQGAIDPTSCNDTNRAEIYVFGHDQQIQVTVVLDNLGKGASGAAVQNMNLVMGISEQTGLQA